MDLQEQAQGQEGKNMETGTSFITLMKEWETHLRELSSSKGNTNDSSEAPVFKDGLRMWSVRLIPGKKDGKEIVPAGYRPRWTTRIRFP